MDSFVGRGNKCRRMLIVDNLHADQFNGSMLKAPPRTAKSANGAARANGARVPAAGGIAFVQSSSLSSLVQKELERMIVAGDLPTGSRLNESAVAESLGVSRGPVREAFRGLEEAGLVRFEKTRGVYVRQITVEEADEIYEVRAALDEFVGRRLAQAASPDVVRELRALVERLEKAAARGNVDAYAAANLDFHDRLVALAGNAKLLLTYRRLVNELNLYRRTALQIQGTMSVSTREHRDIVEKIAAGQVAAAGKALYEHVMGSRGRMHRVAGAGSGRPDGAAPKAARKLK